MANTANEPCSVFKRDGTAVILKTMFLAKYFARIFSLAMPAISDDYVFTTCRMQFGFVQGAVQTISVWIL